MMHDVALLLAADPVGGDPWSEAALSASRALSAAGASVDVQIGIPDQLPEARVVLCHGIQFEALLRGGTNGPVIVSDLVQGAGSGPITRVDWCWADLAAAAGRFCAERDGVDVGFVAGPAVPTQRGVVAGFADGLGRGFSAVHLPAFDGAQAGARAGKFLVEQMGCGLVAHSADSAGAVALDWARNAGAETIGFLAADPADIAWMRSDITAALSSLATRALEGEQLPETFAADEASGFASFEVR